MYMDMQMQVYHSDLTDLLQSVRRDATRYGIYYAIQSKVNEGISKQATSEPIRWLGSGFWQQLKMT
jgi:hypothetical protein